MITVDDRCTMRDCPDKNIYRMVGSCYNCKANGILILQTVGHSRRTFDCPLCGCDAVHPARLATDDEIPVGAVGSPQEATE